MNRSFIVVLVALAVLFLGITSFSIAEEKCCPSKLVKSSEGCGGCTDGCSDNQVCSTKLTEAANKYPSWILSSQNETYFSQALLDYRLVKGKYPKTVKEFLDSGLVYIWPANPVTGKPMELVDKVKPVKSDLGKIAYVWESDEKARFETVIELGSKPTIYKFPCCQDAKAALAGCDGKTKPIASVVLDSFERSISGCIKTGLLKSEFMSGQSTPTDIKDICNKNFFLIKENLKPEFISADPNESLFLEKGIGTLDGKPVKFEMSSMKFINCEGKEAYSHSFWIATIQESDEEWFEDEAAWNKLENKKYLYSTREILNGGMHYPEEVLISKSDIL